MYAWVCGGCGVVLYINTCIHRAANRVGLVHRGISESVQIVYTLGIHVPIEKGFRRCTNSEHNNPTV